RKQDDKSKPKAKKQKKEAVELAADQAAFFNEKIELKVAKITKVENNPEGEKLYIEHLDDGSGSDRIIQSGLREYLKPEDLLGKHIILAANLAPRTMRGVESHGMLLAADYTDENGKACVEPLEAPWAAPGTKVILEGASEEAVKPEQISADDFFKVQINVVDGSVQIAGKKLTAKGKALETVHAKNGGVN
ncbi:MAG: methionine--tRNA ligase, partial [Treponema sp.]|nr:methionine--tRNA ligase [Treponema sp.]